MRRAPQGVRPGEIAEALDIRPSTLSVYLSALDGAGLIRSRREGRAIYYSVDIEAAVLGMSSAWRGREPSRPPVTPCEVSVVDVALRFTENPVIEHDGRLLALVYPDLESVDRACLRGKQVEDLMEDNRRDLNLRLPAYCQIAKLTVLYEEFEKTPTKKIKRRLYNVFH